MRSEKIGTSQLRSFGLIVAVGFSVVALWPAVFRSQSPRTWALGIAVGLAVLALIAPAALKPFHRVWTTIGEVLGWVNTRVILGIVYYVVIVPVGAIRRMVGDDPMHRKFEPEATTYKVARSQRSAAHMWRQY
jgi:hypothetical protein